MRGATGSIYTLAEGEGKPIEAGASFTRDPGNRETLAASLEHTPDTPGGEEEATSELRFNEEFGISYQTLRDDAFSITNGTVTKARRLTQGGSPALAGIDRNWQSSSRDLRGFPRTRGDRPWSATLHQPRLLVPPHSRG